jgi:hypothetical protein
LISFLLFFNVTFDVLLVFVALLLLLLLLVLLCDCSCCDCCNGCKFFTKDDDIGDKPFVIVVVVILLCINIPSLDVIVVIFVIVVIVIMIGGTSGGSGSGIGGGGNDGCSFNNCRNVNDLVAANVDFGNVNLDVVVAVVVAADTVDKLMDDNITRDTKISCCSKRCCC